RREVATADDGTQVAYQVVGDGPETVVLANGLGGRLYSWLGLIDPLQARFRFISWDYRGLFESAHDVRPQQLSVGEHARDLMAILDAEDVSAAHIIGWSMGVQVGLEFALRAPDRVQSLVLINGTYGQVFSTAFQPFFPMPLRHNALHGAMELFIGNAPLLGAVRVAARTPAEALFWLRKRLSPSRQSTLTLGMRQYMRDVTTTDMSVFLRLFQELDAHSVYHELPEVTVPATVISGAFDYLTPAYQSRHIARRLPNAHHVSLRLGTHFVLLERPEAVLRAVEAHFSRIH
ncbi:MAG: alpha/beta hydrolase, partial [Myxococcales bacterium]|nr:alpha/beta hydrolase [Myxococcales bacterium]